MRVVRSVPPPGGDATITRTGLTGYDCAIAHPYPREKRKGKRGK
jgi:hypothetical protein